MDLKKAFDFLTPQGLKDIILNLQNRNKDLMNDNSRLHAENETKAKKVEELENRIRQLIGEKPKPEFDPKKNKDRTSGKPKDKTGKTRAERRKKEDIEVDKKEFIPVPTDLLDSTFENKGTRKVVIQEIAFSTVALIESYQLAASNFLLEKILKRINKLFIEPSGWVVLDTQKKLTAGKLERLLRPLYIINAPTNNNLAERDIRGRVVKRKISLFNQSWRGAMAWDFWGSMKETCRKLGVNFWSFIYDRVSLKFEIPALAAMSMS